MSALPNPLPSQQIPKKPAGRAAKTNKYGRDPQSPSEKMRVSDLDTLAPFIPVPVSFLADLARLTSGNSCTLLLMVLWAKSAGRGAPKGEKRPEWTNPLLVCDLAQICRCDNRTIERELKALGDRGLGEVKKEGKSRISARLLYRNWEALPDYKSNVVEIPPPAEPEVDDEAAETKEGFQRLTGKNGMTIKAGAQSKAIPVNVGVKAARFQVEGAVDIEFRAVIQAGEQVVKASVPALFLESLRKQYAASNVSNDLTSGTRHGRRDEKSNHSPVVKVDLATIHPKAAKLCEIFNPILMKFQAPMLESNLKALESACAALGDFAINDLVAFLGMGRATRELSSPRHVALVIQDAKRDAAARVGVKPAKDDPKSPLSPKGQRVAENLKRIYGK
jgi:hypothetical protein